MSDDNGSATKAGAWTTEAKLDFLMHIIAVINDNKPIPWSQINIPGRTTKSLQNMWTKINKELTEIKAANGVGATPSKTKATPRKRGPSKAADDDATPTKAKKRAAPTSKAPSKKSKKEEVKDETESDGGNTVKAEEDEF